MIDVRPFASLGAANHGWLDAHHHFSFGGYHDPKRMGWGAIRVWNDDQIQAGHGFPPHPHANMEIITYVFEGAISHRDSLGNSGRTDAGSVQVMSAGSGIQHAEFNQETVDTRLFQIWVIPDETGGAPTWGTQEFPKMDRSGRFIVLASGLPEDRGALPIRASARVMGAVLKAGAKVEQPLAEGRVAYLVAARGRFRINGVEAQARDGVAIEGETSLVIEAIDDTEIVVVEATA